MNRGIVLGLSALLCVLAASPASAQRGAVLVGVNGGGSQSELKGGAVNTDFRWGGTAGVFAAWRSTPYNVLAIEVNWIQKGGKDAARVDYIEIPFIIGAVAPVSGGSVRVRPYTGIDVAFKVGCTSEAVLFNCDQVNSTEWSWPIGITFGRFTPSGTFFGLDVRYMLGLSDVFATSIATNRGWVFKAFFGKQR